jgi:hypothetical protein
LEGNLPMKHTQNISKDRIRSSKKVIEGSRSDIAGMRTSIRSTRAKIARSQWLIKKLGKLLNKRESDKLGE